eukprot:IDg15278t1
MVIAKNINAACHIDSSSTAEDYEGQNQPMLLVKQLEQIRTVQYCSTSQRQQRNRDIIIKGQSEPPCKRWYKRPLFSVLRVVYNLAQSSTQIEFWHPELRFEEISLSQNNAKIQSPVPLF